MRFLVLTRHTDALVAGWGAVAASFDSPAPRRGYRPSNPNAAWERMDAVAAAGGRPSGWETTPWCTDPDCDEITRTHQVEDGDGLRSLRMCTKCHPKMRF